MSRQRNTNREKTLERERRAWEMRQKLWTHERIAEELTRLDRESNPSAPAVDRSTVTKLLKRVRTRVTRELEDRVEELRGEQVEQLMYIASEAMEAWQSSKNPSKDARRIKRAANAAEESRVKTQNADPRFLSAAMDALKNVRDIMGLDSPVKVAPTDPSGKAKYDAGIGDPAQLNEHLAGFAASVLAAIELGGTPVDRGQTDGASKTDATQAS